MPTLIRKRALRKGKKPHRDPEWRCKRWNLNRLIARERGLCKYCRKLVTRDQGPRSATIDHVVPIHAGGLDEIENMVLACSKCNQEKGTGTAVEIEVE